MNTHFYCSGPQAVTSPGMYPGGVGVYLHGQAEDEAGYDIPDSSVDLGQVQSGIRAVTVNGTIGYTLFLGRAPNSAMLRGLIVKDTDSAGMAHAQQCYDKRSGFI